MGRVIGPDIVTDNLVLYLDAGNSRSYNGSGTTWYDLSKKLGDATIYGSMAFDGSSFITSSTGTYAQLNYSSSIADFSLAQTICMWIKPATGVAAVRRNPYNQAYGGPGTITHEISYAFTYYYGTNGYNGTPYQGKSSTFTVVPGELAFICVNRDQTANKTKWYKNGIQTNESDAGGYPATANGANPIIIGRGYTTNFAGNIYNCMVYNRALTASEILKNYNATKGRYD